MLYNTLFQCPQTDHRLEFFQCFAKKVTLANNNYTEVASGVLKAIGGKANVSSVDYCATRLRFTIKDYTQVDEKAVKAAGAAGVIRPDKNTCQVIIGTKVQFVYDELKKML